MEDKIIEINNIKKYFETSSGLIKSKKTYIKAIDDVSLAINRGEIVGLVGESGSGKTTLARLILKLIKPTENTIKINGIDIFSASNSQMKEIRKEVAVVFQDPASNLNPRKTVLESIIRPMIIHGVPKKEAIKRAEEAIEKVQLDKSYLDRYPHQLSGGQQQRISIARALVLKPKIMILDEPTSALDISVQAQVLNLLLDIQEEFKLTYLVITHDLNVVRYISDKVAVMYLGKLVEYGETDQIFDKPNHPYTKGLMEAAPIMDPENRGKEKFLMSGEPDSLINLSEGCRLSKRCPYVTEKCLKSAPELYEVEKNHFSACYLNNKN